MTMNFQQLRCFHAVASHGSFTAASRALFVGQPSITTHVKSLELRYGVELFYRHGHTVILTNTGERLLDITRKIFELENQSEEMLKAAGGLLEGEIRISAFDPAQVARVSSCFHSNYPSILLKVSFGNADNLVDSLLSLKADVSMLPKLGDKRLFSIPYKRVNVVLVVNNNSNLSRFENISVGALEGQKVIVREKGSMQQRLFNEILEKEDVNVRPVLEIDSQDAVREAIAAGMGVGVALDSDLILDTRLKKLNILSNNNMPLTLDLEVACLLERKNSPMIKAFFSLFES